MGCSIHEENSNLEMICPVEHVEGRNSLDKAQIIITTCIDRRIHLYHWSGDMGEQANNFITAATAVHG